MRNKKLFRKWLLSATALAALFSTAASAYANPVINENPKGTYGYSITNTYFNFDNYGFMEAGPPMDAWKFTYSGSASPAINFSVDTTGAFGGFVIYDTTYSGVSTAVFSPSSITPGSHVYSLPLVTSHQYTIYVQPTGPIQYNYHFSLY